MFERWRYLTLFTVILIGVTIFIAVDTIFMSLFCHVIVGLLHLHYFPSYNGNYGIVKFIFCEGVCALLNICFFIMQCSGLYLITMSDHHSPELPYLNDPKAINYVESSKLMVLITNTEEQIIPKIQDTYGLNATCILNGDER